MFTRRFLLFATFPALAAVRATRADDDETPKSPTAIFDTVFPRPTGANGMEEIIRAGERLSHEADQYYLSRSEFTLMKKREYVALPACRDAIVLLRRGLGKPLSFPASDPGNDHYEGFASLRAVARMLAAQIYVACADGYTEEAVRIAGSGLTFARAAKGVSIIGLLVAVAIEAMVLNPVVRRLECFSVRDCRRLQTLMEQTLALPDLTVAAFDTERRFQEQMLERWGRDPESWAQFLEQGYDPDDEPTERGDRIMDLASGVRLDPDLRERLVREMQGIIAADADRMTALFNKPTGLIAFDPPANVRQDPSLLLVRETMSPSPQFVVKAVQGRVSLQLVAVHAAIRAYRWEYDRLPGSLSDLRLPAHLLADPFTGESLVYKQEAFGTMYELFSNGALQREEGEPDRRYRITFPWTKPK